MRRVGGSALSNFRSESIGSSKEKGWTAPLSACSLLAGRNRSAIDVGKGGRGGVCSLSRKKLSGPETGQSATTHIQSKVWDSWFSSRSCRTCCKPDRIRSVPRARHDPLAQIDRVGRRPGPSTVVGVSASKPLATTSQPNPIHSYSTLDLGPWTGSHPNPVHKGARHTRGEASIETMSKLTGCSIDVRKLNNHNRRSMHRTSTSPSHGITIIMTPQAWRRAEGPPAAGAARWPPPRRCS